MLKKVTMFGVGVEVFCRDSVSPVNAVARLPGARFLPV